MSADQNKPISPVTVVIMLLLVAGLPFLPLLISWQWRWWEAWVFWGVSVAGFIVSRLLVARRNPDLITERARYTQHDDAKGWDKILSPLVGIGSGLIPLAAGLDARFGTPLSLPLGAKIVFLLLIVFGYAVGSWALIENRFFSGMVRIQTERGHRVVSTGPYGIVRHPGYASSLFTFLSMPFFLDSLWAVIPAVSLTAVLVVRTALEDRTLRAELPGYEEFTRRTRFRLIPGIW
jgi:protein-S-isoprenylcysteine O-methyltransferase Ste14